MGGMFSVVKVRDDVAPGDHRDPGPYRHPPGTLAHEYTGALPDTPRAAAPPADAGTVQVRKPAGPHHH